MKPFDLQVNGYAGVDFNHLNLTADDLHLACQRLKEDRCGAFLATIITDSLPAMEQKLHRLATFREADALARQMISGLHIEGPFLNPAPGYIGAHPKGAARPADPDTMARLLDASGGLTRLVTLAPEQDPRFATTRFLADQGITVAAGHCNPDL
ncbi:MAG: N-acetylglucosamine-6-phosphate deacetylase, partial [Verrucomicrobiota bacterium]